MIIEGKSRFISIGSATFVEEDREVAWAQPHITRQSDIRWLLTNFVEAENPNSNGHIVETAALKKAMKTIPNKPMNINHIPGRRVGVWTAAEMVYPLGGEEAQESQYPIVEALGAFWQYYEPEILPSIEMAHREGQLFSSMECVPDSITCKGKGEYAGCGETFAYDGRVSDSYCEHLNESCSRKTLHNPHYTAGALIIPPVRPGWKNADVKEISMLLSEQDDESLERLYGEVADLAPQVKPLDIEKIMTVLLSLDAKD